MLAALAIALFAGAPAEAPPPRIELAVVGPGDAIWSLYGHAGLVVRRPKQKLRKATIYNFGITDWNKPNYVREFLTGRVQFWGGTANFGENLDRWKREDRTVHLYPVQLPSHARRALQTRLDRDVSAAHKHYLYDTFRDNCATRLRDYLDTYSGGAVYAATGVEPTAVSYRDDVRQAYSGWVSLLLLTELVPGISLDAPRTAWELAYRPVFLGEALKSVSLADGRALLGPPRTLNTRAGPDPIGGWTDSAQAIIAGVAALLMFLAWLAPARGPRTRGVMLAVFAGGSAFLGTLLVVVAFGTDWPDMKENWLALAFVPVDALLLWSALRLLVGGGAAGGWARGWVHLRVATTGLLVLTTLVGITAGPLPPRLLALAGVMLALRCLGTRADPEGPGHFQT